MSIYDHDDNWDDDDQDNPWNAPLPSTVAGACTDLSHMLDDLANKPFSDSALYVEAQTLLAIEQMFVEARYVLEAASRRARR